MIDNLDVLKVNDYIKVDNTTQGSMFRRRRIFVGMVTKTNKEQLFLEIQFEFDNHNMKAITYSNKGEVVVIPKTPRKTKKRKLKHKKYSHNHGTIIHKLSKNEIRKIKTDELLMEIENEK